MKKITAGILTAVLVLFVGAASVFAARDDKDVHFADADRNRVCAERTEKECRFADDNKDGICDNRTEKECRVTDAEKECRMTDAEKECRMAEADRTAECNQVRKENCRKNSNGCEKRRGCGDRKCR